MRQEHIEKIKGYYDRQGEYKINSRYSGEQGVVYTKADDNARWLVIEQKGENGAEVRRTDDTGRIIVRDTYESIGNTVKCTGISRKRAEGKGMVRFEPNEINLIYQSGKEGRQGTVDVLKAVEARMTDDIKKMIVRSTIHKLSGLSEERCSELILTTKNRKLEEQNSSIRKRLAEADKRLKKHTALSRDKSRQKKRENIAL